MGRKARGKITATRENKTIILFIDLKETLIDGKQHALDVPPRIINGRTLVPIRFVSESLGDFVYYDNIDRNVMVTKKQMPVTNVTAQDIANNGNGSDLNVSFKLVMNRSSLNIGLWLSKHQKASVLT
ncbi:hypothetical protein KHA80_13375 [Anaerobacillus sp. HL2]|nr:hypothetical protein KHA80_13375 [Anaerobacillus sp. HL2]